MRYFAAMLAMMVVGGLVAAGPVAAKDRRLAMSEIRHRLIGNTVSIPTLNDGRLRAYLAPGGKIRGQLSGKSVDGRWSVRDDELCTRFSGDPATSCDVVVLRDDERLFLFNAAGEPVGELSVRNGDPRQY